MTKESNVSRAIERNKERRKIREKITRDILTKNRPVQPKGKVWDNKRAINERRVRENEKTSS